MLEILDSECWDFKYYDESIGYFIEKMKEIEDVKTNVTIEKYWKVDYYLKKQ